MEHQKLRLTLIVFLFPVLIWGLIACGGGVERESAPLVEPAALEATAEIPTKVEHQAAAAPTAVTEPVADQADPVFEMREPVSLKEATQLIDLRKLPNLNPERWMYQPEVGYISYITSEDIPTILDFYRSKLTELGWQESPENRYIGDANLQLFLTQGDFVLFLGANKSGDGGVLVDLINHGNIDTRALPVYPEAEILGGNTATDSLYVTSAEVDRVVEFVRKEMAALGWQEYARPNGAVFDDPDDQSLTFKKKAIGLTMRISVAPAEGGKTLAQYSARLLGHELPTMAEAGKIEYDDDKVYLSYTTAADIETVMDFYRQELTAMDYEEAARVTVTLPTGSILFAHAETPLLLNSSMLEDDQTQVILYTPDPTELTQFMAPDMEPMEESMEEPVAAPVVEVEPAALDVAQGQSGVPDLPLPADAQGIEFDADFEEISFTSPSDLKTLAEFYREALPARGWQEDDTFATVDEDFGTLLFEQGEAYLDLTFSNDGAGHSEVWIYTDGLAWDEAEATVAGPDLESGSSFEITDWPIPAEAEAIKVGQAELSYIIDRDFQSVMDFYRPAFDEWGLSEFCLEVDTDFNSYSCSTGSGDFSLSVNLYDNIDDRTEVSFFFHGLEAEQEDPIEEVESEAPAILTLVETDDGLPIPSNVHNPAVFNAGFRRELSIISVAELSDLVDLYRSEMPARGWTEQSQSTVIADNQATLIFEGPQGSLMVEFSYKAGETKLYLTQKLTAEAKEMGVLPPAGQARLYMGSMHPEDVTVTIAGQTIKVAPTSEDVEPNDLPFVDLAPGSYSYTLAVPGTAETSQTLDLGADQTWVLMILGADAAFPFQTY